MFKTESVLSSSGVELWTDEYFAHSHKKEMKGKLLPAMCRPGRGVSEKVSAVSFCLGSGLFGSYNSD